MYNNIKKSDFYENLSTGKQLELEGIFEALINTHLTKSFYYREYEKIHLDQDFTKNEIDFVYNLGIKNFEDWKFAFAILVYRKRENKHFLSLFKDKDDVINYKDLNSINRFATDFHNSYNNWSYNRNLRKEK
jgi:hypothetical protein